MLIQKPDFDNFQHRRHGVVVACRGKDNRWLMMRRGATVARAPLKVGFPGGEIEPGETQPQAAIREFKEEFGVEIEPLKCVWNCTLESRPWVLWGWYGKLITHNLTPDPHEVEETLWLTDAQAANHPDALPTNTHFLRALAKYV